MKKLNEEELRRKDAIMREKRDEQNKQENFTWRVGRPPLAISNMLKQFILVDVPVDRPRSNSQENIATSESQQIEGIEGTHDGNDCLSQAPARRTPRLDDDSQAEDESDGTESENEPVELFNSCNIKPDWFVFRDYLTWFRTVEQPEIAKPVIEEPVV